ncbi:MAG TPA: SLBB domain-containing protein [Longimicrobium sp.]|jgi:protein involved in polysaccharide export with SLBB domain
MSRSTLLLLLALAAPVAAQAQPNPGRPQVTRAELQAVQAQLEAVAASPDSSDQVRSESRDGAAAIQARLRTGDLRVGDRVSVIIEGLPALSDTFTVSPGPGLALPTMGTVPVGGLLRSELSARVAEYVARYIRSPVVHVQPLVRVAVEGAVGRPGFYEVPADARVTDVLMESGGLTTSADMRRVQIQRLGTETWGTEAMQFALAGGWTLDQLDIHPGDRIVVAEKRTGSTGSRLLRVMGSVGAVVGVLTRF